MKTAKDIMQTQVVKVGLNDPLLSVYRLFADEEISGAPVVDEMGRVVGVLSVRDLIRATNEEHDSAQGSSSFFQDGASFSEGDWLPDVDEFEDTLSQRVVADVMTDEVISVSPDTPVQDIVKKILECRVHRVLVVDDTAEEAPLVGLISLFDLIKLLDSEAS